MEHFRQPNLNALIVRPLVDRLYDSRDNSIGTDLARPHLGAAFYAEADLVV